MRIILFAFILFIVNGLVGQADHGLIIYERTTYYSKILEQLPYLSEEEKERQKLTWGKDEGWSSNYNLTYTPKMSSYTYGKNEKEYNFSWKQDEFLLLQDMDEGTVIQQRVLGSKLMVIEDEVPKYVWKVHNELREVAGYLCMKAVTRDTIKDQVITAWFSTDIPVSAGPEGYGGLPGMILMLDINNGTAIVEATSVDHTVTEVDVPKKIKGKKVTRADYNETLGKYFEQCIEGERNPYWQLRY